MKLSSANINVMVKACRKAAKNIIRDFGEIEKLQVSLKGPGDFVTASDKKAEKILIEELQKARPRFSILSEEIGQITNDKEFKWIIDPIDGTANFLHGIPHFAISLGLEHKKEIICGIIFDPIKDEMFLAEKGNGSYLNNQRLRVSSRSKLKDCLIITGGPSFRSKDKDRQLSLNEYYKFSSKVMIPIRKMGSASLDMAYVAAGRCDGFWQRNLNYWDIAAGIIMVKEAGGFVTDFEGENKYTPQVTLITQHNWGRWVWVMNFTAEKFTETYSNYEFIGTLTHAFNPKLAVFGEYQAIIGDLYADDIFRAGGAYLLTDYLQIDVAGLTNLKDTPSRWQVQAGLSVRLNFHKDTEFKNLSKDGDQRKARTQQQYDF